MSTKPWAIFTVLATTLLTSTAQILWKIGSKTLVFSIPGLFSNFYIIGGILLYVIGGALLIISFRGGEVSVLYPLIATSYIWVSFLSMKFLGELMNFYKWIGIIGIIAGIVLIGYGSKNVAPGAI